MYLPTRILAQEGLARNINRKPHQARLTCCLPAMGHVEQWLTGMKNNEHMLLTEAHLTLTQTEQRGQTVQTCVKVTQMTI